MPDIRTILTAPNFRAHLDAYPFLIAPPTDDRPFFFHFLRGRLNPENIPSPDKDPLGFLQQWHDAVVLLYLLIAVVTTLAAVFFSVPLLVLARRHSTSVTPGVAVPLLLYFACLGYGFMMIEIPLLQRFVLFLGYPVYALAVVLFALLLFSGTGSLLSARFEPTARRSLVKILAGILAVALTYLYAVPVVISLLLGESIVIRIAATVLLLAPIGLLLGMAYPLGISVLREHGEGLVPWAWALNGAFSVMASVLAIFLGSRYGFSTAFLTGVAGYGLALVLMAIMPRPAR